MTLDPDILSLFKMTYVKTFSNSPRDKKKQLVTDIYTVQLMCHNKNIRVWKRNVITETIV